MAKQLMMLAVILWGIFSFTSCAVQRPNADICIVNAPNKNRRCQNLKTDYDDSGNLLPGTKPFYKANASIADLNKFMVIDSPTGPEDGIAALKAYIQELRDHYANCQAGN